jgi:hypothetical protein
MLPEGRMGDVGTTSFRQLSGHYVYIETHLDSPII